MRKLIMFLAGLMLLVTAFGIVFLTGAIYDAADKQFVETYFFQPNNFSYQRTGEPVTPAQLGDDKVRDMLIEKYVYEYFYVIPSTENIAQRTGYGSVLQQMSFPDVYKQWVAKYSENMQKMAEDGWMRTVTVKSIFKRPDSDYWQIEYELQTWTRPNDMSATPQTTRGIILLALLYENRIKLTIEDNIDEYLRRGHAPATMFRFIVGEAIVQ